MLRDFNYVDYLYTSQGQARALHVYPMLNCMKMLYIHTHTHTHTHTHIYTHTHTHTCRKIDKSKQTIKQRGKIEGLFVQDHIERKTGDFYFYYFGDNVLCRRNRLNRNDEGNIDPSLSPLLLLSCRRYFHVIYLMRWSIFQFTLYKRPD